MAFSGIKKSFAQKKHRTSDEINQDYSNHAIQVGHKTRIIMQYQREIDEHSARMIQINQEALDLPKEVKIQSPEAQSQAMTQDQEHA